MRRIALSAAVVFALAGAVFAGEPPRRIVSTSPSITEILFALGLGDRVVGVSQYCRHPPAARTRAQVGSFLRPDVETIARLTPDLVVVHTSSPDLESRLAALRLRHVAVDRGGLAGTYAAIREIGAAAGVDERAQRLIAQIEADLAGLRKQAAGRRRPRVLLIVGRRPGTLSDMVAVGPGSYLSELLAIAGGDNVLATDGLPEYPRISLETVVRLRPDVVIDTADMGDTTLERRAKAPANLALWNDDAMVKIARLGKVHAVTTDALVVPGPRVVEAARWLARLIHGGAPR
jgi:iron complex transport system substrate-binding protein